MTTFDPGAQVARGRARAFALGFWRQRRIRRMLHLAGQEIRPGWPRPGDRVIVWGQRPVSRRGRWVARQCGSDLITVEDGFLHSIGTGTGQTLSLVLDDLGIYFDGSRPSRLERLLLEQDLAADARQAAAADLDRLKAARLSKYTPAIPATSLSPGYVLVVDQTAGDASIAGAGVDDAQFERMLSAARAENPGCQIVVKSHPAVISGQKCGHFTSRSLNDGEILLTEQINPWDVLAGAKAVYTVSSQFGYEAILAGLPVRCFGAAFYAGWGLTEDEIPCARRSRTLTALELFAGCHLAYPIYYDPWRDCLTDLTTALEVLQAELAAAAADPPATGDVFAGVRLWKRRNLSLFRPGRLQSPRYEDDLEKAAATAKREGRTLWLWGSKYPTPAVQRLAKEGVRAGMVEDGFLRSVGLGAELTQAASVVFDRDGIYFDPSCPSELEGLITTAAAGAADEERAHRLRTAITAGRVTKYNLTGDVRLDAPPGTRVLLVPGQVEDDASIERGCGAVRTNTALLRTVRQENPDAWIVHKPHPDVEAGLRKGEVDAAVLEATANQVVRKASIADLLDRVDEVWTMTSLMGLEALLRQKPVTCLGTPFYAGWGLTHDLGPTCPRRVARPTLDQLVWAALIAYPSYVDPVSGLPCTPELVVERLAEGRPGRRAGLLSKLQALMAQQSWLWRR